MSRNFGRLSSAFTCQRPIEAACLQRKEIQKDKTTLSNRQFLEVRCGLRFPKKPCLCGAETSVASGHYAVPESLPPLVRLVHTPLCALCAWSKLQERGKVGGVDEYEVAYFFRELRLKPHKGRTDLPLISPLYGAFEPRCEGIRASGASRKGWRQSFMSVLEPITLSFCEGT